LLGSAPIFYRRRGTKQALTPLCGHEIVVQDASTKGYNMNSIIYLVGLVVVVLAILSFIGLR